MAKRLNKNLVVSLTLALMIVVIVAGYLAIRRLPAKSPKQFVDQAVALEKQAHEKEAKGESSHDDLVKAAAYYQRAANRAKVSNDTPATCEYLTKAGDLLLASGDNLNALKVWSSVVRLDPSQITAQEKIVKFSLEIAEMSPQNKNWIELQSQAEQLLDAAEKHKTVSYVGLNALGRALINQREAKESNFKDGKEKLIQAVNGDKSNPDYASALAMCYLQEAATQAEKGNPSYGLVKDAAAVLDTLIANLPKDPEKQAKAYLARAQLYATNQAVSLPMPEVDNKKLPEKDALEEKRALMDKNALADYEKAIQLAPANEDAGVGLGLFWQNKMVQAQRDSKVPPAKVDEYRKKAQDAMAKAIQSDPQHYLAYIRLADLYNDDKQYDKAIKVLDERLKLPVSREGYQSWRNREYIAIIRERDFKANLAKFSQIAETAKTTDEAKALEAPVLARLEELQTQTKAELGDQSPLTKFMEGRLWFLKGDMFAAGNALSAAAKLSTDENPEVERYLAIVYSRTNSPGAAEKSIGVVLSHVPNGAVDVGALLIQAAVKNQLGKPQEALYAADKALAASPNNVEALRAKAQAYAQLKNYEALNQINSILSKGISKEREQLNTALLLQQQALQSNPLDEKKLAQAADIYRETLKSDPTNNVAFPRLVGILARTPDTSAEANKVIDDARASVEKKLKDVAQTQPSGDEAKGLSRMLLSIDLMKIEIDPSLKGEDKAQEKEKRKEEIVRKEADPFTVAMTLFQLHRDANRADEALQDLKAALVIKPEDPIVLESMLQMAIAVKDWKLAEDVTSKAVACGLEKTSGHIYRGQILLAQEKYSESERELRAAVLILPEFAEGHAQLGRALLAQKQVGDARAAFGKALQLNPMNAYALIGMAIISSIDNNEAEKQRYLALASQVAPNNAWIQSQMRVQEDRLHPEEGITRREQMRKQNPKDIDNLLRLADLYRMTGNVNAASQPYEDAIKLAPDDLSLVDGYAHLIMSRQPVTLADVATTRALFERVIREADPKNTKRKAGAQLLLADFLSGLVTAPIPTPPSPAEVDQAFEAAGKTSPSYDILVNVGQYYLRTKRIPEAIKRYRQARDSAEAAGQKVQARVAQQMIVDTLLGTMTPEAYDETDKEIKALRKAYPDEGMGLIYTGEFQASTGHEADAVKSYSDYITHDPQNPLGYVRRGLVSVRRGDWDAAIKDFREAKQRSPNFDGGRPRIWMIDALRQSKQDLAALTEAQELADDMPASNAALQKLFNLYIELKRYDGAESLVNARSQQSLASPVWDDWRRRIAMARKDNDAALRYALAAAEKSNYEGQFVDTYISLLLMFQKYDEAIDFIDHKLPPNAHNDFVVLRQASAYASKGDIPKSIDLYDKAVSTPPVDLSLLQSVMGSDPGLQAHAGAVNSEIEARYQKDPKGRSSRFLACVYRIVRKDPAGALALVRELAAESSDQTPALAAERAFLLRIAALLEYELKHYPEARDWYLKQLEKNPRDAITLNNLAYLLMDQLNDPKSSLAYARTAVETIPENATGKAGALDTLGWNLVLIGEYDEAVSRLGRSLELDPTGGEARYHLSEAYYRRSQKSGSSTAATDIEEAKKQLRAADEIMVPPRPDPDNVRVKIDALAGKLGVKLAHAGGKAQSQPTQ